MRQFRSCNLESITLDIDIVLKSELITLQTHSLMILMFSMIVRDCILCVLHREKYTVRFLLENEEVCCCWNLNLCLRACHLLRGNGSKIECVKIDNCDK